MSQDDRDVDWPAEAGPRDALPRETAPPGHLESRVVAELVGRGLIESGTGPRALRGRRGLLTALAVAASVALVAIGAVVGRLTSAPETPAASASPLTGAETDLYALLLYETEGYEAATGAEALTRYREYSRWVAEARRRGQFVTGEDLEASSGWLLTPSGGAPAIVEASAVGGGAPLSGIFFVRARDADHALALARELPHLEHGGAVVVQKTLPTDQPPEVG